MELTQVRAAPSAAAIVRIADLGGTFVFAIEGAFTGIEAGFNPIGVLALAFVSAVGGGIIRDLLLGGSRPVAISDGRYALIVLGAALAAWMYYPIAGEPSFWLMVVLDAAGLGLFAVAGTEKALDQGVHVVPAIFLGTVSGVGGGAIRDLLVNEVPRLLHTEIYASAALLAAIIVTSTRRSNHARLMAVIAGSSCFALRVAAVAFSWELPRLVSV